MKTYNLIYDKSTDLEHILNQLTELEIVVNQTFSSLGMINVSSETETFSNIEGIIDFEEDTSINPVAALEWHQLRVASRTLPMKNHFIAKNLGEGIDIYLVDSGIKADHSEFEDSNIVNLYSHNDSFDDDTGHGTGIASVIIGKTLGIATEATLKNVKIPMGQSIPLSSLLEAFNAIVADKDENEFAVINCSWTIPKSMILDNLVADLRSQGFLVVAAAGNTISDADNLSPVGYDAVLGVGASDAFDRVISWGQGVGSNFGKEVDLFAPGIDVMIANKEGGISETSGTSISAGIVSGIAAQYIHDFKNNSENDFTVDDIQSTIIVNAVKDILFRNETIYENTPNRLAMALSLTKYYNNDLPPLIKIMPTETYELKYDINKKYVSRINIDTISLGIRTYHHPDWITIDNELNIIYINPPEDVEENYYSFFVEFISEDGTRLMIDSRTILVGDPDNLSEEEIYLWILDENSHVVLLSQFESCTGGNCDSQYPLSDKCADRNIGKYAYCVCDFYGFGANCLSYL
jgi:hypothetical protein